MREPGQNVALAGEAFGQRVVVQQDHRELERHLPLDQTVDTLGQPDEAHAAAAQFADQTVGPDHRARRQRRLTSHRIVERHFGQRLEKRIAARGALAHHAAQRRENLGVFEAQAIEPGGADVLRLIEVFVQQSGQGGPDAGSDPHRVRSAARIRRAFCQSRRTVRSVIPRASPISGSVSPAKYRISTMLASRWLMVARCSSAS